MLPAGNRPTELRFSSRLTSAWGAIVLELYCSIIARFIGFGSISSVTGNGAGNGKLPEGKLPRSDPADR